MPEPQVRSAGELCIGTIQKETAKNVEGRDVFSVTQGVLEPKALSDYPIQQSKTSSTKRRQGTCQNHPVLKMPEKMDGTPKVNRVIYPGREKGKKKKGERLTESTKTRLESHTETELDPNQGEGDCDQEPDPVPQR